MKNIENGCKACINIDPHLLSPFARKILLRRKTQKIEIQFNTQFEFNFFSFFNNRYHKIATAHYNCWQDHTVRMKYLNIILVIIER